MRLYVRFMGVLALVLALGGCWLVQQPLIAPDGGTRVPGIADGTYTGRSATDPETLVMKVAWNEAAKGYDVLTQGDADAIPMLVRAEPIGQDGYILQAEPKAPKPGEEGIAVLVVRVTNGEVALLRLDDDRAKAVAGATGATLGEFGALSGTSAQISAFLKAVAADPAAAAVATFSRTGD